MNHHDADAVLGQAQRVVEKATAAGADEAEVYWTRHAGLDLDMENDAIQSTGRSRSEGAGIRIIKDGRVGYAYFTHEDGAKGAIARALDHARLAPAKGMHLPHKAKLPRMEDRWDPEVAELDVAQALELATAILGARQEHAPEAKLAGGGVEFGWSIEVLANSHDVAAADRATSAGAGVSLIMQEGERAISAWDSRTLHVGLPDAQELVQRVGTDVQNLRNPAPAKGGVADILFRPDAVTELINGLVVSAVDGDDALRGKTVWSDALGEAVADKRLHVLDDPLRSGAIDVAPFDGDGLPAHRLPIIEGGILRNFLFDVRDGHEHGRDSTHSAVRPGFKSPPSVGVQHLVVEGPGAKPDERLAADIDRGFLVASVLGAHTANATTGDFSVTAPTVWRIEGGEVKEAVSEIAIGGNLPDLLKRLDGIGDTPKRMDGAWVPMLRFRDVHVSV